MLGLIVMARTKAIGDPKRQGQERVFKTEGLLNEMEAPKLKFTTPQTKWIKLGVYLLWFVSQNQSN